MATTKQRTAAKVVVSGGTPTEGMREANYAPSVIRNPQVLTESKGYREVLAEYGLTEELVVTALADDIKNKPGKRVVELSLGSEILGLKKAVDKPNVQNNLFIIGDEQAARIARRALARLAGSETEPSSLPNSDQSEVRPQLAS